jgi:dynein heavy chain
VRKIQGERLKLCLFSYPVLFKDCDEFLDPILLEILSKKSVVDPNFRLYLMSRMSQSRLSSMHYGWTQVINCQLTRTGVEEQLLTSLMKIERGEFEEIRQNLLEQIRENEREQKNLDDSLLRELTTSTG